MVIQKISKDSKRGIVIGSNRLTPERIAAGAITAASLTAASAIGGLISRPKRASTRPGKAKNAKKSGKKGLLLLAAPVVFKAAKSALSKKNLDSIAEKFSKAKEQPESDEDLLEIESAIPISSEEEVYEHI